jgi:hypothetical protein
MTAPSLDFNPKQVVLENSEDLRRKAACVDWHPEQRRLDMDQPKLSRFVAVLCLFTLATVAAQCSEEVSLADEIAANSAADTAIAMEETIFPEATATPTQTPEPEPTEVVVTDEADDVNSLTSGNPASGWGAGLDIYSVAMGVDPDSGRLVYRVSTPGVEDSVDFILSNPNWGLIIAGDGDPEGTPALPGLDVFGMGQWHIGCFAYTGEFTCELWVRQGSQFVQEGESFGGQFVDGAWTIVSPMGFPKPGDRIGVAVVDPYYVDTVGLENWVPRIETGLLQIEY